MKRLWCVVTAACVAACGSDPSAGSGGHHKGGGGSATGGSTGEGGGAGGTADLETLLAALRADAPAAMLAQSRAGGWPAALAEGGHLFVSLDPALSLLAGDHDAWAGTPMTPDQGFAWIALDAVAPGQRYKFSDSATFVSDPWSRGYAHDEFGVMSMVPASGAHLERHFEVASADVGPRTVRVFVPAEPASHVLYVADGQNLFDPMAPWGGWDLAAFLPAAMMAVGIDNTPARFDEYTHVPDDIGQLVGGEGDAYADFVDGEVRALIAEHYGEPPMVGVMGSSLGGLISFHIALRHAPAYHFAASLSGTMGWGSIGASTHNPTMISRYAIQGHFATALYLDSGGGGSCVDADQDGIEDDAPDGSDNHCENAQLAATLIAEGWVSDGDLWSYWEPGATHDEAAWAARVWRPLDAFAGL